MDDPAFDGGTSATQAHEPGMADALITIDNLQLSTPNTQASEDATSTRRETSPMQSIAWAEPEARVARYLEAATADATRKAYRGDLKDLLAWGGSLPCSPDLLASYIVDRAPVHSPATIMRRVVGIGRAHTSLGMTDPSKSLLVRTVIRGLRRVHGKPQRQAAPLLREDLFQMLDQMRELKGMRDRALLLVGFAAALRRSELVGLDVEHINFVPDGMIVHLQRSKTDQDGDGRKIAVPFGRTSACPVRALLQWLEASSICTGAVFRGVSKVGVVSTTRLADQSVSLVVKAYASTLGLRREDYSAHSLRAGLVTSAARAGVSIMKIQEQTGHRSHAMLSRYIRIANAFENNAAGSLL